MHTQIRSGHGVSPVALKPALALLSRVIRAKTSRIALLQCVKLEPLPDDGMLRLSATDLDIYLSVDVPATLPNDARPLLVRLADLQAAVKAGGPGRIELPSLARQEAVEDYPATPVLVEPVAVPLDAVGVGRLLHAFTCASADETRHVIQGVFLDPGEDGRLVGTDGHHLVRFEAPWAAKLKAPVILPDHRLWAARSGLDACGCTLRVGSLGKDGPTGFELQGSNWSVSGKCIEGCYPNYRQVIPSESQFGTRVNLDSGGVEVLANVLEDLPGKLQSVGLRITSRGLGLLHHVEDQPGFLETIVSTATTSTSAASTSTSDTGTEVVVMLNRQYLAKALRFGFGRVELIDAVSPVKFSSEAGLLIVMPLRCEGPIQVRHAARDNPGSASARNPAFTTTATHPIPDQSRRQTMRTSNHNGHDQVNATEKGSGSTARNGSCNGNGSSTGGCRGDSTASSFTAATSATPVPGTCDGSNDPVDSALEQLGQLRDTLKGALSGLGALTATLKEVRQQQRDTEREIRTVRSTLRSLRELRL